MNIGLVGATNTGKSTLFNRLIGQFRAIVTDIAGTTIDIIKHKTSFESLGKVIFSDSPGLSDFSEERPFIKQIIDESEFILFVIDGTIGITAKEEQIATYIIENRKKENTICVINKLDRKRKMSEYDLAITEFYAFGFPHVIGISAKNQNNLEEIISSLAELADKKKEIDGENSFADIPDTPKNSIQLAIIGKPNVGKSTLLNHLIGEQLSKIEDKAGTTRDYIFGDFKKGKQQFRLYDTAGIKKKGRMRDIEKIAYKKTLTMLTYIRPMVLFLIDAQEGISHRDMSLLHEIHDLKLPLIVCLNKIDLLNKEQTKEVIEETQGMLNFAKYIPIVPISAIQGTGENDVFKMIKLARKESHKRIDTNALNKAIANDRITRPPRFPKNKVCKIFYATQIEVHAPKFMFFINHKNRTNFAFKKWVENTIRLHFGFIGVPLNIFFKERIKTIGQSKEDSESKDQYKNYEDSKKKKRNRKPKKDSNDKE